MKRLFALFFLTWYSVTATGATQLVHYCQHSASVHLNHSAEELTQELFSEGQDGHTCCHSEVAPEPAPSHHCCSSTAAALPGETEVMNTDDCCVEITQEQSPYVANDFEFSFGIPSVQFHAYGVNFDSNPKVTKTAPTGLPFSNGPPLYVLLNQWVFYG